MVMFPLTFLSNAFVPASTLPDWLQTFVKFNPVSHVVSAVRSLANDGPFTGEVGWALLGCGRRGRRSSPRCRCAASSGRSDGFVHLVEEVRHLPGQLTARSPVVLLQERGEPAGPCAFGERRPAAPRPSPGRCGCRRSGAPSPAGGCRPPDRRRRSSSHAAERGQHHPGDREVEERVGATRTGDDPCRAGPGRSGRRSARWSGVSA